MIGPFNFLFDGQEIGIFRYAVLTAEMGMKVRLGFAEGVVEED